MSDFPRLRPSYVVPHSELALSGVRLAPDVLATVGMGRSGGAARAARNDRVIADWNPETVELASEDDRAWFADHPGETVRHREAFPGELPRAAWDVGLPLEVLAARMVEVEQIVPGFRVRRPWLAFTFEVGT